MMQSMLGLFVMIRIEEEITFFSIKFVEQQERKKENLASLAASAKLNLAESIEKFGCKSKRHHPLFVPRPLQIFIEACIRTRGRLEIDFRLATLTLGGREGKLGEMND